MDAFGKKLLASVAAIAVIASLFTGFLMAGIAGGQPPTCPLDEDFSGSWLPSGWTQEEAGEWSQSSTNNAGGTSPEAHLHFSDISGNYSYLDSTPVDTSGMSSLTLEFKSYINDYCGGYPSDYDCKVYTRADAGDGWTDVTPWSNPISGNVGPDTYTVDISSDIGSATQVRFEFSGFYYCLDDWYVDDVKICGIEMVAPPPSQVFVMYVCGDKLVYDAVNDVYFYPHLLNMLSMNKTQQQDYCDQLNANAYGQITDWHFANLKQMMGLLESMTGQTIEHPGPNLDYNLDTTLYFPVTGTVWHPSINKTLEWTMGRTTEEAGVYIELPYGQPYPQGEFVETSWSGDVYLSGIPTEGQYHWAISETYVMFDDDLNWVADDAFTAPMIGQPIPCSAWFVSETGPPRPNPNSKYLHSEGGLFNITDPVGTQWHELWPFFCKEYHLSSWEDNGDGVLSHCDWIDIYEKPDGALKRYHVEDVTITLNVTLVDVGDRMFIELKGGYNASALKEPVVTRWHEIYPCFCNRYDLMGWSNINVSPELDAGDMIWLADAQTKEEMEWFVEGVAIDIIVTPEVPPVGGEAYPVDRASLLAPWIGVGVVLAGGISWYVLRRRRGKS